MDANSKGEYYDPIWNTTLARPLREFHEETLSYVYIQVQENENTVCGHHCVFYLIHRWAGHAMTDVTRILEDMAELTIVQNFVLLLAKYVL
jgi:hypothetical protein